MAGEAFRFAICLSIHSECDLIEFVMGEVRRGEALDMIQSMISGHAGSLTTVHASNPMDALIRIETLCLMAGMDIPVYVVRRQVASAVHIVLQLARLDDGSRRVISIAEIMGMDESQSYISKPVFEFRSEGRDEESNIIGQLKWTGRIPSFHNELTEYGFQDRAELTKELFVFKEHEENEPNED